MQLNNSVLMENKIYQFQPTESYFVDVQDRGNISRCDGFSMDKPLFLGKTSGNLASNMPEKKENFEMNAPAFLSKNSENFCNFGKNAVFENRDIMNLNSRVNYCPNCKDFYNLNRFSRHEKCA